MRPTRPMSITEIHFRSWLEDHFEPICSWHQVSFFPYVNWVPNSKLIEVGWLGIGFIFCWRNPPLPF